MKKLIIAAAFILFAGTAFGQTLKKGAIIEIHHFTLNLDPDVTMNQWLDFALNKYLPVWETHYEGIKSLVVKGDRGDEQNKICWINCFESEELRAKYFKDEGIFVLNEHGEELLEKVMPTWDELSKLGTSQVEISTDWVILPINASSNQTLQKGNLLGAHLIKPKLDPDVTMNQYLDFVTKKYIPTLEKSFEGWKVFLMKADRGEYTDEYMWLYWIESLEARDRYLDSEGNANDEGNKAFENVQPVFEEMLKLGTWSSTYTDWVIQ